MFFGIPKSTINDWKNQDAENWRFKLYTFIKLLDENKITERQIQINQRIIALKCIFGEDLQHYKFEILDEIFQKNPEFLKVSHADCEKKPYMIDIKNKILNSLNEMKSTSNVRSALYLINKVDCTKYVQIIFEYKMWLNQQKGEK